jgi:hypothetical protein
MSVRPSRRSGLGARVIAQARGVERRVPQLE